MSSRGKIPWNKGTKGLQVSPFKGTKGLRKSNSGSFKKGQVSWNKGKTMSTEARTKMSVSATGRKLSDSTREKLSEIRRYEWKIGARKGGWKHSEEWKKARSGHWTGIQNPKWIEDRSMLAKRQERNDTAYKEWRKAVRDRDGWKCKIGNADCNGNVVAHHILPWSKFPELRYEVNNGITLCRHHHPLKRNDEVRLAPLFQELVQSQ